METVINYTDRDTAYVSSDERKIINRIHALKEKHPDEVRIIAEPENNDGCIYATLPPCCVRLNFPNRRELSDEEKNEIKERLANYRNSHL